MVLNAAVQMLMEAEELKQKILKFKSGTSMLQDRTLWATQQQLQKVYQKVLVLDLDYALDKKVEQDLWNIGFKQQIEALQSISKDRKNPSRSEGQAMLSWVLQAAAGFYLCLLHQICTTFKLDLPFRRRASLVGVVEGWSVQPATAAAAAARYIAQHCLVHLGDLARYRHHLTLAHTFYRHALLVSAHSGQPYNQLALVAWRRGRKLAAVYWHVRSLLVRAPFPPAPANLARTLAAAREMKDLPVLPGITTTGQKSTNVMPTRPLDARSYVNTLLRTLHMVHTLEDLETATQLVNMLNSSLSALIATDNFESMTLVKMTCVTIWLVHWATESLTVTESSLSASEAQAASLGGSLAAGALLAMLLPAYTLAEPPTHARPALKVYLQWVTQHRQLVSTPAFISRPQLWPALAHTLNKLADGNHYFNGDLYESVPLPEDEELHGFLPIEGSLAGLKFLERAAWDTFGDRIPDFKLDETQADDREDDNSDGESSPSENTQIQLAHEPELEHKIRSHRLIQLGRKLAEMCPEMLSVSTEDGRSIFTASSLGGEQLSKALAELSIAAATKADEAEDEEELEAESDEEKPRPAPPIVISEADFREKVREKRVGILKPQGSLERAREERAMANTQDDPEPEEETVEEAAKTEESKKEATRKQRVNIAMAAIMRKQEETNKQVKFVTPPPTPDSTTDTNDASATNKDAKPKVIQPKAIKSLANLPIGRKTGGILSLKDKSAGYPHLQNTDPEPVKKTEKDDVKKESKASQSLQSTHQTYNMPKKQEHAPSPNWPTHGPGMPVQGPYEGPRFNLQHKNYGLQNTGLNYNPNYQAQHNVNNQGIRLPVVNPKEIDVRSAALQKQNLRQEPYQDGHKFGNQNYQISGDKKNFLNDLPPRFANQYRYWQSAQDNQLGSQDNKFREDNFQLGNNTLFGNNQQQQPARPNWMMNPPPQMPDTFHQPPPWWKPDNPPPNFTPNFSSPPSMNLPNFYSPHLTSMPPPNPYQNMPSFNQNFGQNKLDQTMSPNYLSAVGQPQMQTVQNLVSSQNFNSSLNNFGSYQPAVSYDSSMYPQFNKLGYQQAVKGPQYGKDLMEMGGLNFGSNVLADMRRSPLNMNFKEPMHGDVGGNALDHVEKSESGAPETQGNTYSLFSGAPRESAAWGGAQPQQSLWSGPGPSPLERLLEQQKQMKQPPTEPQ